MSNRAGRSAASDALAAADAPRASSAPTNPSPAQLHGGTLRPPLPSSAATFHQDTQAQHREYHEAAMNVPAGSSTNRPRPDPHAGNPNSPRSTRC